MRSTGTDYIACLKEITTMVLHYSLCLSINHKILNEIIAISRSSNNCTRFVITDIITKTDTDDVQTNIDHIMFSNIYHKIYVYTTRYKRNIIVGTCKIPKLL